MKMNSLTTFSVILTCAVSIISLVTVIVKITRVLAIMQEKMERTEIRLAGHSEKIDDVYKTLYEYMSTSERRNNDS